MIAGERPLNDEYDKMAIQQREAKMKRCKSGEHCFMHFARCCRLRSIACARNNCSTHNIHASQQPPWCDQRTMKPTNGLDRSMLQSMFYASFLQAQATPSLPLCLAHSDVSDRFGILRRKNERNNSTPEHKRKGAYGYSPSRKQYKRVHTRSLKYTFYNHLNSG